MVNKGSSRKGWSDAEEVSLLTTILTFREFITKYPHQVALLLQFIPKSINWNEFEPPEGRTIKACQERLLALRKKANLVHEEGDDAAEGKGEASPKTPRKRTPKKGKNGSSSGNGKATASKKRKVKEEIEDDNEEEESPSKRTKVDTAEGDADEAELWA